MAKTLLDFTPSNLAALKDSQLVYLVDPSLGRAGDVVVTLGTLKEFLGVTTGGGTTEPPPPPPPGTVATPTFSPAAGNNTGPISVVISSDTAGATIRYTLDGSTPTSTSTLYTGAISVSTNTTVKAIAIKSGMVDSAVGSAAYTFSSGGTGGSTGGSNPTGFINLYGSDRAEYPRTYITSRMPVRTGALITVAAGGNFQAALDSAQPGDWIILEAGATFTGNYTLPLRNGDVLSGGNNVIVVTTSAFASLPEKVRVTNATSASLFAKLRTTNTSNIELLVTTPGTSGWRFVGIDFGVDPSVASLSRLVAVGSISSSVQATTAQCPKNIMFDRCRFDGHSTLEMRRALTLEGIHSGVINSWFGDDIHYTGQDCQAILSGNTPGPLKIVNNRLQGSTEVTMFGGFTAVAGMVSDVEVRYNLYTRPTAWRGVATWAVKNIFEIKKARRVLIEGNIFEHVWVDGQTGIALLIKHEPYGDEALGQTEDIIFKNNIIRDACGGINTATIAESNGGPCTLTIRRVVDYNNLFYDIAVAANTADQAYIQQAISNTCVHAHSTFIGDGNANSYVKLAGTSTNCVYKDNLFADSQYGVKGDDAGVGIPSLNAWAPGYTFSKNILVHANTGDDYPSIFPSDNFFPTSLAGVNFVDLAAKNYALASSSLYKNQASDGTDPGADIAAVNAATAYAISGDTSAIQT